MDHGIPLGAVVLLLALLWDSYLGEPPARLHPVVWIGQLGNMLYRPAMRLPAGLQVVGGSVPPLVLATLAASTGFLVERLGQVQGLWIVALPVSAFLLKSSFAIRELVRAGREVGRHLAGGHLDQAQQALRSLVSRNAGDLDADRVASAAVESLGENLCDSIVAPLFYYCLFGLPGALAYRAVNTLDAMFGYHGEFERVGKVAARLDDVLNLAPARLSVVMLWLGDIFSSGWRPLRAVRIFRKVTESPNAGWTMAAMAGALGVMLEKPGHYAIAAGSKFPEVSDIDRACKLVLRASLLTSALALGVQVYANALP